MKLNEKRWFRVLVVLTSPIWIIACIPIVIIGMPVFWLSYGIYTYIKDGKFEEL